MRVTLGPQTAGAAATARGAGNALATWSGSASRQAGLATFLIYGAFVVLIALPLFLVLVQAVIPGLFSLKSPSLALDFGPLFHALSTPRVTAMIVHSLALSAIVAVTATMLGGIFACLVQRCDVAGRRALALVPWIVFLTPSYLKSLAWVLLMSPGGYLAQLGLVSSDLAHSFFSLGGLIFVSTLSLFPLASFIIAGALNGLGSEWEDAARLAGARPATIWLKINLPLLAPAIALTAIATFAEGLSDFGLAATIARASRFDLLTYGVYTAASDYPVDFPLAGAQALILLCLVLVVVLADRVFRRQADPRLISGRSRQSRMVRLGAWRWPATVAALIILFLAIILPLAAIAARALTQTLGAGIAWSNFTLENVMAVVSLHTLAGAALLHSLAYALIAALIACVAALLLSIELDRSRRLMRPVVLGISLGAVAIPGIVLGFGYILLWNRLPGFRDWPFPHYGESSLLVTGYAAAALPYCLIVILAAIGQLAPSLSEAARLQGAGPAARLMRITLPLILLSVVTAFLLTFIRTIFELPLSQLLIPLSGSPLPPVVIRLFNHDGDGLAAALSLVGMIVAGGGAALVWFMASRALPRRIGPEASMARWPSASAGDPA
jgi:iron(III) transport system permease protein